MTVHRLKIYPDYYYDICSGKKTAEIRLDDRDYNVGDTLYLCPWTAATGYTDDPFVCVRITHILKSTDFPGLSPGFSLLSFHVFAFDRGESK